MTLRGFGGGGDNPNDYHPTVRSQPVSCAGARRRVRLLVYGLWAALTLALLIALKIAARGGCSLPPADPLDVRRDAVCVLLGRGQDCRLRVKDTMSATIDSDELTYRVFIAGEFVGEWPIANDEPIDPALMTRELVDYHLQFQTGDPEFQQRLRSQFHCRRLGFIDRVLEWHLGVTKILIACVS